MPLKRSVRCFKVVIERMLCEMPEHWLASLKPTQRKKAEEMILQMMAWGAPNPEEWVQSEIEEEIPQTTRFLVLRTMWANINSWRDQSSEWTSRITSTADKNPRGYFADAGAAVKRMQDAGVTLEDLGRVARFVSYESIFSAINRIDEGGDPEIDDAPGWALVEVGPEGDATGRIVGGLHEDLLMLDPSGRDGAAG